MTFQDVMKWNKRAALVYAVGVWTMVGSYALFKYTGHVQDLPVKSPEEGEELEDPYRVVHETPHSKTVIAYKKDFVPFSTRIRNFINSFSSKPGSGDGNE